MATSDNVVRVHFIDDSTRLVPATGFEYVGEEGARRAIALVDGREVRIYNRPDWPDPWLWEEQMSMNDWLASQVEEEDDEAPESTGGAVSGLHQCQYCYNLVNEEHEEFCRLNPNRNREIVP